MGEKEEEKNATVPVKLPLTDSTGTEGTQNCYPHQISVSDLSTRVVSLSTRWQETQKFRFSHPRWREMSSLFSIDTCFMAEHKTASNSPYQKAMASQILNWQPKLYCQYIQRIIFQWPNIWEPFTEPHMLHKYHLWNCIWGCAGCSLCVKEPIQLLSHCHLVPYHEPWRPF